MSLLLYHQLAMPLITFLAVSCACTASVVCSRRSSVPDVAGSECAAERVAVAPQGPVSSPADPSDWRHLCPCGGQRALPGRAEADKPCAQNVRLSVVCQTSYLLMLQPICLGLARVFELQADGVIVATTTEAQPCNVLPVGLQGAAAAVSRQHERRHMQWTNLAQQRGRRSLSPSVAS